jgi:hypothetical protein
MTHYIPNLLILIMTMMMMMMMMMMIIIIIIWDFAGFLYGVFRSVLTSNIVKFDNKILDLV